MASFPERRRISNFFEATVGRLLARWRQWTAPDRYRPEKHYMRGPGPKNSCRQSGNSENDSSRAP
jgi:hypothetical protein